MRGTINPRIRQSLTVAMQESPVSRTDPLPPQPVYSRNNSHSWAVGPRVGVDSQVLLPAGFQFEAGASASLLYTQYTQIKHSEASIDPEFNLARSFSMNNLGCLRPNLELDLGMGWGTYLADGQYHLSFSADYDFMIFWSQNMMRVLMDAYYDQANASPGDLYFQGLTFSGRFDF